MSLARDTAATRFEQAADAAKAAETAYRKAAAAEVARLERERVTAFRRVRLVRLLEEAAAGCPSSKDALEMQRSRLCREFGWSGEAPGERAVLERIGPMCAALALREGAPDIAPLLAAFEAWFEADRGVPFYSLFESYVQETPVVDF